MVPEDQRTSGQAAAEWTRDLNTASAAAEPDVWMGLHFSEGFKILDQGEKYLYLFEKGKSVDEVGKKA